MKLIFRNAIEEGDIPLFAILGISLRIHRGLGPPALVLIALLCGQFRCAPCFAQEKVDGDWVGGFEAGKQWVFVKASFKTVRQIPQGTIDIYENLLAGEKGVPLVDVTFNAPHLHFGLARESGAQSFDGECQRGICLGNVVWEGVRGAFQLRRIVSLSSSTYRRYIGTFQLEQNHYISVWPLGDDFGWDQLGYLDFGSGDIRALFPISETTFVAGPALWIPCPTRVTVTFVKKRNGEIFGLKWREGQSAERLAAKVKLRREDVRFQNGQIKLAGTLVMPQATGVHPAVVLVHGSGAIGRDYYRYYADFFALHGIAVLGYDKRGVGQSTGDWHRASLYELTQDALAGLRFLQTRKDVDARKIGLWGSSQGGWIVSIAAATSSDVAFIVSRAGPGVSPAKQDVQYVECTLRADGFSENDITEALTLLKLEYNFALNGTGWEQYEAARTRAQGMKWFSYVDGPESRDSANWLWSRVNGDFDPIPFWEQVKCPSLVLFGEQDTIVPPIPENVESIRQALERAGNRDYTIDIVPQADHLFWITPKAGLKTWPRVQKFSVEAIKVMTEWILKRMKASKQKAIG